MTQEFAYHRSLAPMMWVLFALSLMELIALHILLINLFPKVAIFLTIISLMTSYWIVSVIRSFMRLPVLIDAQNARFSAGKLKKIIVPTDVIEGVYEGWDGEFLKLDTVLNLALVAYPNLVVKLCKPQPYNWLGKSRQVQFIAHKFDDPAAVRACLDALN